MGFITNGDPLRILISINHCEVDMKKIIVAMYLVILCMMVGCVSCIKYPERQIDKVGNSLEIESCHAYKVCMYYVAVGNLRSDCKAEWIKCCKDSDFEFCKKKENLPVDMKFQECWDKLE